MNSTEIKILVVDDHQILRQGLRLMLEQQPGFRVVGEAATCDTVPELVRTTQPDVVVMDIHLAGGSGIEASRQVLADFPAVKIVILSADADLPLVHQALQAGVSAYLTKDGPQDELVRAIRVVVDHRMYLSPEIASVLVPDYLKMVVNSSAPVAPVLTDRERTLLKLVAAGKRNKEIADELQVGVKSVEAYRTRLMRKLNCASAADLIRYAIREGLAQA